MGEEAARARRDAGARPAAHPLVEEAERVAASLSGRLPDAPAGDPESPPDDHGRARVLEDDAARTSVLATETAGPAVATPGEFHEVAAERDDVRAGGDEARAGDGAAARSAGPRGGVRGRAAAVGASVGGSLKPRVERLREASSVVIDEAADDPGVRFLVAAVVLFLLFLLLWLLSFTLG
jgi:hypothetical protein